MEFQGFKRKYTVVAPENPGPNLLLFLHGSLQNGSVMRRFTNGTFDELAARTGTVVVYPDGVDRHFNDARAVLPVKARELGIDDVAFLQHVAATVQEEYGTQRTFACGYSNGGQMVIRLLSMPRASSTVPASSPRRWAAALTMRRLTPRAIRPPQSS
ncbi:alpha/beta hydrolase family protein [Corynebacterium simulans]|uniref:Alpha/beta hydrolase family protein n=1 Tax=Corynebacterium simulans TaxID=146827 RepID=A0ABR5V782_9CORY|nr:alpha/beta hydrolase family protein [Corynebacterium simulans]